MPEPLGVGFVGCGEATQAIHLPVLATMGDDAVTTVCMDVDENVAEVVAGRVGARPTTSFEDLVADDTVDVVVICSPSQLHADQVVAACEGGKKLVLCEKPLASTSADAARVASASAQHGVPVVVGTMHAFDPAWAAVEAAWGEFAGEATFVRSTTFLPPNPVLVAASTDLVTASSRGRPPNPRGLPTELFVFELLMLNLAIHHVPLVRRFLPSGLAGLEVDVALPLGMSGYVVSLRSGDRVAQLVSVLHQHPETSWTLEAVSRDRTLCVEFPPSYVRAGSATATLAGASGRTVFGPFAANGYVAEWRHVLCVARGEEAPLRSVDEAVDDVALAELIASAAPRPAP